MSRYIDADKLIEEIKSELMDCVENCDESNFFRGIRLENTLDLLQAAPIVEAEPIKHCKPIRIGGSWACSNCEWSLTSLTTLIYNYCPYCGAKIDGEVTE